MGKLDNTLIIYQNGDNGTSAEGGPEGTFSEVAFFNGVAPPVPVQMKFYDAWGTEFAYNHMSAGWSWAFDTPFTWFKQNASRLGGICQNMAVSWPARIKDKGALREQFMHVIDVAPTILTVAGLPVPGVMEGRSLLSRPPVASWPDQRVFSQYGSHLYSIRTPRWKLIDRPAVGRSQLFDLRRDPGETRDVAAEQPEVARKLHDELMAWRQASCETTWAA